MVGFSAERLAAVKVGKYRYNSPWTQVILVGFVCFCSVGMFGAVGGLGAGGTENIALSDTANGVLYGVFAISGFFAGSINNILGPRLTLCIGSMGYCIYVGGLWAYQTHGTSWFLILAGGILGFTAALLWSAEGAIMMSYPEEKDKGRSFSLFWSVFSLGGLVGSCIALGIEADSTLPAVSTGVYLAFLIIMLTAIFTSWSLLPPNLVVRNDGTLVEIEGALSPRKELDAFIALFKDWRMLALFPMFFASNYFYAYQGALVTYLFNGRTRALASVLESSGAIIGSIFIGFLLDGLPFQRRTRAICGWCAVVILELAIWAGGLGYQVRWTRADTQPLYDYGSSDSAPGLVLIFLYYVCDAAYQGLAYYTMSAISNEPFKLARMAGYYKGLQSAGAAVSYGMDAVATPYLTELLVSWIMVLVSLPLCLLVLLKVRDTNYDAEKVVHVEDLGADAVPHAALPVGHHAHADIEAPADEKTDEVGVSVVGAQA